VFKYISCIIQNVREYFQNIIRIFRLGFQSSSPLSVRASRKKCSKAFGGPNYYLQLSAGHLLDEFSCVIEKLLAAGMVLGCPQRSLHSHASDLNEVK